MRIYLPVCLKFQTSWNCMSNDLPFEEMGVLVLLIALNFKRMLFFTRKCAHKPVDMASRFFVGLNYNKSNFTD